MTSVLAVAGLVTVMLAALAGLGAASRWSWRFLRKLGRLADDWIGEEPPPGQPDIRPGVLRRLDLLKFEAGAARAETASAIADLRERVAAIEAQLQPNGGLSLRDAVDRLMPSEDGMAQTEGARA